MNRRLRTWQQLIEALADEILPQLRRSKFIVDVDLIGLSDEEILAAIKGDASVLSLEQMLYAATLTNDPNEMLKYYQMATDKGTQMLSRME